MGVNVLVRSLTVSQDRPLMYFLRVRIDDFGNASREPIHLRVEAGYFLFS